MALTQQPPLDSNPDPAFIRECQSLGKACAKARMRCDEKAPLAFKAAHKQYRGPKEVPSYFGRKWLSLRLNAIKRGMVLDAGVTPAFLKSITPAYCPVTLEPIDIKGRSERNPSVDRLLNDGTYAPANLIVLSLRANRAKGEKTFEDIEELIAKGDDADGLSPEEWLRLLGLMYGAWNMAPPRDGIGESCIVPMTTYPPRHILTSTCQLLQLLLVEELTGPHYPDSLRFWLQVTAKGGGYVGDFMVLSDRIRIAAQQEPSFRPHVWQNMGLFQAYVDWYLQCHKVIWDELEALRAETTAGLDLITMRDKWLLNERHRHSTA